MLKCGFYAVILLVQVIKITADQCLTPKNEQGSCISLYSCPRLIQLLENLPKDGDEYVGKSRCGTTPTEPLVCCPSEPKKAPGSCTTPKKQEGKCTSLSSCPELLKLLKSQQTDSIEYVRKSGCKITDREVSVCCPTTNSANSNGQKINKDSSTVKLQESLFPSYCGYQHSDDIFRKDKGVDIFDFPWLVSLNYKLGNALVRNNCHGSIINQRYILTSAQCANATTELTLESVRLGEYSIKDDIDCVEKDGSIDCNEPAVELGVEKVVVHPEYHTSPHSKADIALIRLNASLEYSDFIRPICLPLPGIPLPQFGDKVITSGWDKNATSVKKKVVSRYITNDDCATIYNEVTSIAPTQMCTFELTANTDFTCGDKGAPVMFSHKARWYVEGIHSFGPKYCGSFPVVHTRVSKYMDWIRDSVKP